MSDQLIIPVFDPLTFSMIRDDILEKLQDKPLDEIVAEISSHLTNWQAINDPVPRRAAERFSLLLSKEEQNAFIRNFVSNFHPFNAVDPQGNNNNDIVGDQGWEEALALGIGILASLAAAALWDAGKWAYDKLTSDPNCVGTVREFVDGECFEWCINEDGFKNGEPEPCDGGSE